LGNGIPTLGTSAVYIEVVGTPDGTRWDCPTGMVMTGVKWDAAGDTHIDGIWCSPFV